jgi:hypothetical protein
MLTNIVALLHTTTAYKAAALQLMIGQANFAAEQLHLNEPLPIVAPSDTNQCNVMALPYGVSGMIWTSNSSFEFWKGRLVEIGRRGWLKEISPPADDLSELTNRVSLVDSNGACLLATQWLGDLSVDVEALGKQYPMHVRQSFVFVQTTNELGVEQISKILVPIFNVFWGNGDSKSLGMYPVFLIIYGPTKELISFGLRQDFISQLTFKSPPLQVTNAAELLGPLPPPRHFIEELVGDKVAYETVAAPDKVEAWLLNTYEDQQDGGMPLERAGPKRLVGGFFGAEPDRTFSSILLDFNSYAWEEVKLCSPDYGLRLRYTRGKDVVEFKLCYECDIVEVSHNDLVQQENFDFAHNKLVKAVQNAFPWDSVMRKLELNDEEDAHKEYQRSINQ